MAPRISTALGVVAGLVLSLSVALIVVIAGNGANNPGMMQVSGESAAGGASAPLSRPSSTHSSFDGLDVDGDGKLTKAEFDRLAKLPPPKQRPKTKPRLREDAAASLAAAREER